MHRKLANEELNRKSLDEYINSKKEPIIIILDNVRSLNNVGSIFRTADAFLVEEVFLCGVTGTPPNKEIEKTALGASENVKWSYYKTTIEAIEKIKKQNRKVYAVEQAENSCTLNLFDFGDNIALVFGNEVYGVEQEVVDICDGVIEIPQLGTKHSLNIAVSAGVVLWEAMREKF